MEKKEENKVNSRKDQSEL